MEGKTEELLNNQQKKKRDLPNKWFLIIVVIIFVLAIVAVVVGFTLIHNQEYKKQLSLGEKYLDEGKYKEAVLAFDDAIKINEKNPKAFEGKAKAYIANKDYKEAKEVYGKLYDMTGDNSYLDSQKDVGKPDNVEEWNGHSYAIFSSAKSWDDAEKYCESLGGHLATIASADENEFLFSLMKKQGYETAFFGYTDKTEEGTWHWVNNEDNLYTNWHLPTEPNSENPEEDYAMFYYKYPDGTWNDGKFGDNTNVKNNEASIFICEWDN